MIPCELCQLATLHHHSSSPSSKIKDASRPSARQHPSPRPDQSRGVSATCCRGRSPLRLDPLSSTRPSSTLHSICPSQPADHGTYWGANRSSATPFSPLDGLDAQTGRRNCTCRAAPHSPPKPWLWKVHAVIPWLLYIHVRICAPLNTRSARGSSPPGSVRRLLESPFLPCAVEDSRATHDPPLNATFGPCNLPWSLCQLRWRRMVFDRSTNPHRPIERLH